MVNFHKRLGVINRKVYLLFIIVLVSALSGRRAWKIW